MTGATPHSRLFSGSSTVCAADFSYRLKHQIVFSSRFRNTDDIFP
ncbi:hypothetical protein RADP37_05073 [Roseomonas mucosa]|uniref:Uncharacterized protein n=1 Tax=Roseomonas mucosa TaxID=207340 RepID=A0A4Y1MYM7_9PROT|nr:hypothetical protein RADP37_05073 [Roseomonas mucosa]